MRDNTQAIRRILANIDSKMQGAMDWTQDRVLGGVGEECVRNIIQMTLRVSERSEVSSNEQSDIRELVEKLCEEVPRLFP